MCVRCFPERQALAGERRTLSCLNCGAACDGSESCGCCATPLMVIDLPRLAHALRQRPGKWSASPAPDGVPMRWECRACGKPLDPSREVACTACGHAVVAPTLLDITPLLMAVEHELRSAELAARPYRRKPARARHWQETGLGMLLHRFSSTTTTRGPTALDAGGRSRRVHAAVGAQALTSRAVRPTRQPSRPLRRWHSASSA